MTARHHALAKIVPLRASATTAQHRALAPTVRLLRIVAIVVLQTVNRVRHGATAPRRAVSLPHAVIALNVVLSAMNVHRSRRRSSGLPARHVRTLLMTFVLNAAAISQQDRR